MMTFFRLVRLPNVFTVVADILMGYLLVHPSLAPVIPFLCLLATSICLYWAGMILNDVFDVEQDRRERPGRPIPSGRIRMSLATWLGWGFLVVGVLLGWSVEWLAESTPAPIRTGWMATIIAVCVIGYNGLFKSTVLGPFLMGSCRTGNILLGMSTGALAGTTACLGFDALQWAVAGGIGIYMAGVTWYARNEATGSSRSSLLFGTVLMLVGLGVLSSAPFYPVAASDIYQLRLPAATWPLVVVMLMIPVIRRSLAGVLQPTPKGIQEVIKTCIQSLIVLDAATCFLVRSPFWWSIVILGLLVPSVLLGRWFYST